jgi:hypothetical protein
VTDHRPAASPDDAPIIALLPRDWPAQLDRLLTDGPRALTQSHLTLVQLLSLTKRLIDDWVLAGADALDALGEAIVTGEVDRDDA